MKSMTFELDDHPLIMEPSFEHSADLFKEIAEIKAELKAQVAQAKAQATAQVAQAKAQLESKLDAGPFATMICRDMTNRVVYDRRVEKIDGYLYLEATKTKDHSIFLWDDRRKRINAAVHILNHGEPLPLRYICKHLSRESAAFNDWLNIHGCPVPSTVDELMVMFTAMDSTQAKYITSEETVTLEIIQTRWNMFINLLNTQCLIDPLACDVEEVLQAHKDVARWVKHTKGDSLETVIRKFVVFVHGRVHVKGDSTQKSIKKLVDASKESSSRIFRAAAVLKKLVNDFSTNGLTKIQQGKVRT